MFKIKAGDYIWFPDDKDGRIVAECSPSYRGEAYVTVGYKDYDGSEDVSLKDIHPYAHNIGIMHKTALEAGRSIVLPKDFKLIPFELNDIKEEDDAVNHPSYYKVFPIESKDMCAILLDAMQEHCGLTCKQAGMLQQSLQYRFRAGYKGNSDEDILENIKKAMFWEKEYQATLEEPYMNEIEKEKEDECK